MEERTKQVQFRMPVSTHKRLKIALIESDSSLADFFNDAAEKYLNEKKHCNNNENLQTDKKQ